MTAVTSDPPDFTHVTAWECEECLDWQAYATQPTAVLVAEPGPDREAVAGIVQYPYQVRRLVVCPTCRTDVFGIPRHGGPALA